MRYADDIVAGFEHEADARRFWDAMRTRFEQFTLELHEEKTRLLEFGRHAAVRRQRRGLGKPETFTFLGFTFICGKSRRGAFQLQRKTRRDRMRATLRELKVQLRDRMHYAILCYDSEEVVGAWTKEQDDDAMAKLEVVQEKLTREGRLGPVARLMPTTAAMTLRKGKKSVVMDGPFAETKEQLLGFFIVDCANLEQAIEAARDLAGASNSAGAYEIRPVAVFRQGDGFR